MKRFPEQMRMDEETFVLDETRLLVRLVESREVEAVEELLGGLDLRLEEFAERERSDRQGEAPAPTVDAGVNHSETAYWARAEEAVPEEVLEALEAEADVKYVAPVYRSGDEADVSSRFSLDPTMLLVRLDEERLDDEAVDDRLSELARAHGLTHDPKDDEYREPFHLLRLDEDADAAHVFGVREALLAEREVTEATYNAMPLVSPLTQPDPMVPNDTHFGQQWNMTRIDADVGWNLTTGAGSVVIGVIDTGCDMTHTDLAFDGPGFDTDGTDDGSPNNFGGNTGHGTCVAGIAAAAFDNNEGIAGVAGDCQIHAVALQSIDSDNVQQAINEARTAGVDVINMSFSMWGGAVTPTLRAPMDAAIQSAHDDDVVLCASSGNDANRNSGGPNYPANNGNVICVGATDQGDMRCDVGDWGNDNNGNPQGSNFGDELDVVAPGIATWSTDIQGAGGYNNNGSAGPADGDYFNGFGGTSGACPHVAGLAALLRSLDPSLDNEGIRDVIERTCEKVNPGTYSYATVPGRPNGTWDDEVGYGRINVYDALGEVLSVELTTDPVTFTHVPEGQTTNAAAVFDVRAPFPVDLEITGGPTTGSGSGEFKTFDPPGTGTTVGPTGGATVPANVFVFFEAGTPGPPSTEGSVIITCTQTNETWDVDLEGHSVTREDAGVVLVLDHSGSMDFPSGVEDASGTPLKRLRLLQDSVEPLLNLLENDDGVGAVAFSDDATPLTDLKHAGTHVHPAHRVLTEDGIDGLGPDNMTSIAEGILAGDGLFDDPSASEYTHESLVVFTDGHDNPAPGRAELTDPAVQNAIDQRVFAIGMGTPAQLQPTTLQAIADGTGGYFQFTGDFAQDDIYRLRKYFLQVLVGATNAEVVVDPERRLRPGSEHRIPFELTEADIGTDVVLLTPRWNGLFDFSVETPEGNVIDQSVAASSPEISHVDDEAMQFYRLQLPAVTGDVPAHGGRWHAVLSMDEGQLKEYLLEHQVDRRRIAELEALGLSYSLSVHARSNVRLRTTLSQDSMEPGATLSLRAVLTEYDLPAEDRAAVEAELTRPDGTVDSLELPETAPGVFEGTITGAHPGVYRFHVRARGRTVSGRPFTREEFRTAGLWNGGDNPETPRDGRGGDDERERLCRLLGCLLDAGLDRFLEERDIDPDVVRRCLRQYCGRSVDPSDRKLRPRPQPSPEEVERIVRDPRVVDAVSSLSDAFRRDE